jgi:hypothetical protein
MLKRLRRKLACDDRQAIDEIVVEAFFETLAPVRMRDPQRFFMHGKQGLRRRTLRGLGGGHSTGPRAPERPFGGKPR